MQETPILGLTDDPIRTRDEKYPQSPNKDLPRLHSLIITTGTRGSGKSMSDARLIKTYEETGLYDHTGAKVPMETHLISPTAEENAVWKELKSLDYEKNVQHKYNEGAFVKMVDGWKQENEDTRRYKKLKKLWERWLRSEYPEMTMKRMDLIMLGAATNNFSNPPAKPKYPHGVARFLVLDDLLGTRAFRNGNNPVVEFCIRNRHQNTTVVIATQSLKGVPKPIRLNASVFNFFRTANAEALIRDCHVEVSRLMNKDQFLRYFDHATSVPYGSLNLDMTARPGRKIRRGWSTILSENNIKESDNDSLPRETKQEGITDAAKTGRYEQSGGGKRAHRTSQTLVSQKRSAK